MYSQRDETAGEGKAPQNVGWDRLIKKASFCVDKHPVRLYSLGSDQHFSFKF